MDHSTGQSSHRPAFTQEMRDRQARGKDPYTREEPSFRLGAPRHRQAGHSESMADAERKGAIMAILDHPEALMASALSNGNTIARERTRLTEMLHGFDTFRADHHHHHQGSGSSRRHQDRRTSYQ